LHWKRLREGGFVYLVVHLLQRHLGPIALIALIDQSRLIGPEFSASPYGGRHLYSLVGDRRMEACQTGDLRLVPVPLGFDQLGIEKHRDGV